MCYNCFGDIMKNGELHSEEWITDARDYWWNIDYLDLILKRLNLKNITSIADIGCGKGYMAFKLIPLLEQLKICHGVDIEETHIKDALARSKDFPNISFNFYSGNAEELKIIESSVDLTVCQTLLLHVKDPLKVICEMKRITKQGGTVMAIETNNAINGLVANSFVGDTNTEHIDDIDKTLEKLKYDLTIQKGIYNLNEGYLSIGDYLPKLFLEAGLKDITVSIVDKACSLIPPYDTLEKKTRAKEMLDWIENSSAEYDYTQMLKYYLAGGGTEQDFEKLWKKQQDETAKIKDALLNETYIMPGGALMYIVTGKK